MRNDDRQAVARQRILAGVVAAGGCVLLVVGLVTGDLSDSRRPALTHASDPAFFWAYMILIAIVTGIAALCALGRLQMKPPDYVAGLGRKAAARFTCLALLAAAGTGYAWIDGQLVGALAQIGGWLALGLLGLAAWPPMLSPGPARSALRAAGTVAVLLAVAMIYRLTR